MAISNAHCAADSKLKSKTRRGYSRKNRKYKCESKFELSLVGTNAAGLNTKRESFFHLINTVKPSLITLQETKVSMRGTIKLPGYQCFEHIRTNRRGGGLLTAAAHDLNPTLITEHEETDILVIQLDMPEIKIRLINAYGPQEQDNPLIILNFWQSLECEICKARDEGCLIIIELDANAKVGEEVIKSDPNPCSNNGKLLLDMISRQNMTIANASDKCEGLITRKRILENLNIENSILDYVLLCNNMTEYLKGMIIDDKRTLTLRRPIQANGKSVLSDHNVIICTFSLLFNQLRTRNRLEHFNFKSNEGRFKFLLETSSTNQLSSCFQKMSGFEAACRSFKKQLDKKFHKCYSKIRISNNKKSILGNKILQRSLQAQHRLRNLITNATCDLTKVTFQDFL